MKKIFRLPDGSKGAPKDVEPEIDLHIDLRAREFEAAGMSRDWIEELRMDLIVGARILRRSPSFAIVALLTLAIGIGANTAIFSVLRSVLLRPLPYPQPEQLVQIWSDHRAIGRAEPEWLTPPDFIDFRDGNTTFASMGTYQGWGPDLTGSGDPQTISGMLVSGGFFDVLQAKPAIGRLITRADDDASAARVVVLTYQFWQRRFGGDQSIVGRQLTLNGVPWTVAGVLSPEFRAPVTVTTPDIVAPSRRPLNGPCGRGCIVLRAIGRMKPNVTPACGVQKRAQDSTTGLSRFREGTELRLGFVNMDAKILGPALRPRGGARAAPH